MEGAALFQGHGVVVVDAPPDEDDQQDGEDAHALREALGAQVLHGQAAEQGADGGADAVQQQQAPGGFQCFVGGEAVMGLGHGHAVDGEHEDAQHEGERDVVVGLGAAFQHRVHHAEGDQGEGGAGGDGDEHFAAVTAVVGHPADGPLGEGTPQDGDGGEVGDVDVGEVQRPAVDGGECPEGAQHEAGAQGAGHAGGGAPCQGAQRQAGGGNGQGLRHGGEGDGQQPHAEQDGCDDERLDGRGAVEGDEVLADGDGGQVDDHVDGEDAGLAAGCGLAAFVEPALDDHVDAHQRQAVEDAQHQPDPGVDDHAEGQREGGGQGREAGEAAHVAHAADQDRADPAAGDVADVVA